MHLAGNVDARERCELLEQLHRDLIGLSIQGVPDVDVVSLRVLCVG